MTIPAVIPRMAWVKGDGGLWHVVRVPVEARDSGTLPLVCGMRTVGCPVSLPKGALCPPCGLAYVQRHTFEPRWAAWPGGAHSHIIGPLSDDERWQLTRCALARAHPEALRCLEGPAQPLCIPCVLGPPSGVSLSLRGLTTVRQPPP